MPLDAVADPGHPLRAIVDARIERTLLGARRRRRAGLAGACMQGLTRNPLADPGILGINAGACLAMVLALSVLGVSELSSFVWFAFLGAAVAGVVVHLVASLGREGATPVKLAIAGAAVTAAVTQLDVRGAADRPQHDGDVPLLAGRHARRPRPRRAPARTAVPGGRRACSRSVAPGCSTRWRSATTSPASLGRRTAVDRIVLGVAIVLLAGTATALAGPIAFVGLLAPHAVRAVVGNAHVVLLPLSALAGAALVVAADTVGRVVLPPAEVQVGIMAAFVGVPFFLALVRRGRAVSL